MGQRKNDFYDYDVLPHDFMHHSIEKKVNHGTKNLFHHCVNTGRLFLHPVSATIIIDYTCFETLSIILFPPGPQKRKKNSFSLFNIFCYALPIPPHFVRIVVKGKKVIISNKWIYRDFAFLPPRFTLLHNVLSFLRATQISS